MAYDSREWLEADGLGGFASGTVSGIRTRRYHAILLAATAPPSGRMVLVNGFEAWIESGGPSVALTSQRYAPDFVCQDGAEHIREFSIEPWPHWIYALPNGRELEHGVLVQPGRVATILYWRLLKGAGCTLAVRPLMSGRDYHSMHHENSGFNFTPEISAGRVVFRPYNGVPGVAFHSVSDLQPSAGLVSQLSLHRGAGARPRLHRGSRVARNLSMGPRAGRGDPDDRA